MLTMFQVGCGQSSRLVEKFLCSIVFIAFAIEHESTNDYTFSRRKQRVYLSICPFGYLDRDRLLVTGLLHPLVAQYEMGRNSFRKRDE